MKLLLTLFTGLFFLVGILCNDVVKDKIKFNNFAIGLSFVVLLNLICFDIAPEIIENISFKSILFVLLGICILKLMDLFVPDHHHDHKDKHDDKKEHEGHLEHIGVVTILALTLHNVIECMALYNVSASDLRAGLLLFLGIVLHNLPLGFHIGGNLKKHKILYILILVLSGFFGGVVAMQIGDVSLIFENYILAFTLGMIIYLNLFEIFPELLKNIKNKYSLYGIILGIIVVLITNII